MVGGWTSRIFYMNWIASVAMANEPPNIVASPMRHCVAMGHLGTDLVTGNDMHAYANAGAVVGDWNQVIETREAKWPNSSEIASSRRRSRVVSSSGDSGPLTDCCPSGTSRRPGVAADTSS